MILSSNDACDFTKQAGLLDPATSTHGGGYLSPQLLPLFKEILQQDLNWVNLEPLSPKWNLYHLTAHWSEKSEDGKHLAHTMGVSRATPMYGL